MRMRLNKGTENANFKIVPYTYSVIICALHFIIINHQKLVDEEVKLQGDPTEFIESNDSEEGKTYSEEVDQTNNAIFWAYTNKLFLKKNKICEIFELIQKRISNGRY